MNDDFQQETPQDETNMAELDSNISRSSAGSKQASTTNENNKPGANDNFHTKEAAQIRRYADRCKI